MQNCPAPGQRAGEADGLDRGVGDKCRTDLAVAALNQREHARMQATSRDGFGNGLGDDLACSGMGGMALHNDRAARGKGRGRVPARGRKGKREVRGAEHGHRPDGLLHQAHFRAGLGLAIGKRRIPAPV